MNTLLLVDARRRARRLAVVTLVFSAGVSVCKLLDGSWIGDPNYYLPQNRLPMVQNIFPMVYLETIFPVIMTMEIISIVILLCPRATKKERQARFLW